MNIIMKHYFEKKIRSKVAVNVAQKYFAKYKHIFLKLFNKNIYTRILITNISLFLIVLFILILFSNIMLKQATYAQAEQDLLRKAIRVNFALTQENKLTLAGQEQSDSDQDLLKFLADSFDTKITVYDNKGIILRTSAEQEVVPGSKIDPKFTDLFRSGETIVTRSKNNETNQLTFNAAIPMGNTEEPIVKGILLETQTDNLNLALNKMLLSFIIGGTLILIIIIAVSGYLAMWISRPISRLSKNLGEFNRGSLVIKGEKQSFDELNILAVLINENMDRLENIQTKSEELEGERTRLFAEISHELRTPLTAIQGFTEAIRDSIVEDEVLKKKYLNMIYTQTLYIARLVEDMLALSRLESGDITVEKLPLDLAELTQGVVMSMEGISKEKNDTIIFDKKAEHSIVLGDVDRMEQILRNLIKNAVMATENGTIKVSIESENDQIQLVIEDNGTGIPAEDLPQIWERFYQAKNQRSNNTEEKGTGLGLVIVKKLVQLQNGTIEAESQLGKGTSFHISFSAFNPYD